MNQHYEQSTAIKVMEGANVVSLIVCLVVSVVLFFTGDKKIIGLIIGGISLLAFFYGQLFIDAAYDLQVTRQTNVQMIQQNHQLLQQLERLSPSSVQSSAVTSATPYLQIKLPEL